MPAANKFNDYAEQKNRGVHNWGSHAFKIALTNVAPTAANAVLADLTQIAAGGGYTAGGAALSGVTITETGGTVTVQANQVVFTGGVGGMATFRYYALYNDTPTSPADPLVMWWDHGVAVTLAEGDTFTIRFNNASPGTIFTDS